MAVTFVNKDGEVERFEMPAMVNLTASVNQMLDSMGKARASFNAFAVTARRLTTRHFLGTSPTEEEYNALHAFIDDGGDPAEIFEIEEHFEVAHG